MVEGPQWRSRAHTGRVVCAAAAGLVVLRCPPVACRSCGGVAQRSGRVAESAAPEFSCGAGHVRRRLFAADGVLSDGAPPSAVPALRKPGVCAMPMEERVSHVDCPGPRQNIRCPWVAFPGGQSFVCMYMRFSLRTSVDQTWGVAYHGKKFRQDNAVCIWAAEGCPREIRAWSRSSLWRWNGVRKVIVSTAKGNTAMTLPQCASPATHRSDCYVLLRCRVLVFPGEMLLPTNIKCNPKRVVVLGGAPCAVRKVGCFTPPVAMGPRVLNSAPPMLFGIDRASFCWGVVFRGVPGINNVIIGAVRKRPCPRPCPAAIFSLLCTLALLAASLALRPFTPSCALTLCPQSPLSFVPRTPVPLLSENADRNPPSSAHDSSSTSQGTLHQYLQSSYSDLPSLLRMSHGVLNGLEYLAEMGVVHGCVPCATDRMHRRG